MFLLRNVSSHLRLYPSERALIFLDNHDAQRERYKGGAAWLQRVSTSLLLNCQCLTGSCRLFLGWLTTQKTRCYPLSRENEIICRIPLFNGIQIASGPRSGDRHDLQARNLSDGPDAPVRPPICFDFTKHGFSDRSACLALRTATSIRAVRVTQNSTV